ncbi:hypothetical protein QZH41_018340, partial [Actinostola sp. cb2023]
MFGNIVNKNARAAIKEYGDVNGLGVEYEILDPTGPPHSPQYSARVLIGESRYDTATASTKKDAKEYAADLALRALTQGKPPECLPQWNKKRIRHVLTKFLCLSPTGPASGSLLSPLPYKRYHGMKRHHSRTTRSKNNQLSAPPDKDPVMLINEYGQKMSLQVKFEDTPCSYPGMFESFVIVGSQKFGPCRSSAKKMARKYAAIVGLKELINWEPKEGECTVEYRLYILVVFEELQQAGPDHSRVFAYNVIVEDRTFEKGTGASKSKAKKNAALHALKALYDMPIQMPTRTPNESKSSLAESHPVSQLNEYGQRKKLKIDFEDLGYTGPDHGRTYSFRVIAGEHVFDCGYGRSKKDAKQEAAKIALKELLGIEFESGMNKAEGLETDGAEQSPIKNPGTKSKVSELYEFCQAFHLGPPEPVDVFPPNRSSPSTHYAAYKIDNEQFGVGSGKNKKVAREVAAELALEELLKKSEGSKYTPVGSTDGDEIAAFSWNCLSKISKCAPDSWRFAGYKVLAAVILKETGTESCTVVSLGTGNKCISGDQLRLDGSIVCDSHAEVIARRGLMRFFQSQVDNLLNNADSIFENPKSKGAKIKLRDGVTFHLYVSTAPCGDAAIFVNGNSSAKICGGVEPIFDNKQQGLLRTKVEKGEGTIPMDNSDGIQTIDGIRRGQRLRTASCSDKLAKWNVLGLQGALLSNIIEPIYLSSLVVGDLYDAGHLARAVCARVEREGDTKLSALLPSLYHVNHPKIHCGRIASHDSARQVETKHKSKNVSLNWSIGDEDRAEVIDACLGRSSSKPPSRLSKTKLFASLKEILSTSPDSHHKAVIQASTYRQAKDMAQDYNKAKKLLYEQMNDSGYGAWELMKKPVELDQFE